MIRRRRWRVGTVQLAVDADNPIGTIGQGESTCPLRTNLSHVLATTAHVSSNSRIAELRPSLQGKPYGMRLVLARQPLAMGPVGAEGEPEGVLAGAVVNLGLDLGPSGAARGRNPMEAVGQVVVRAVTEDDDRGKLDALGEALGIVLDDVVVGRGTNVGAGVADEAVDRDRLADGTAPRGDGGIRSRTGTRRTRRTGWVSHRDAKRSERRAAERSHTAPPGDW